MWEMPDHTLIAGVAGAVLTPLILRWWNRAAPPADASEFDELGIEKLSERNDRIDVVGQVLSFCGLLTAFPFYFGPTKANSFWPLGMGFGLMVILPVTYFWLATRGGGVTRWREFWHYYELKWGVGVRGLRWLFVPLAALGIVSIVMILLG